MKKYSVILFVVFSFSQFTFPQQFQKNNFHPFAGSFLFSAFGGLTIGTTDYSVIRPDFVGMGSVEYYFKMNSKHALGLRGIAGFGKITGSDTKFLPDKFITDYFLAGGGLVYSYYISPKFIPYLYGGASNIWYLAKDQNGVVLPYGSANSKRLSEVLYNVQAGFHTFLNDKISLNFNFGYYTGNSDLLDGIEAGSKKDGFFTAAAGVSFTLFPGTDTETDTDGDGVPDAKDQCANTLPGVKVTADGCPIDSDGDGVADYLDQCPDTPKGVFSDKNGCPLDSDNDGVPDYLDKCPSTPSGASVDESGCPRVEEPVKKSEKPPKEEKPQTENKLSRPFRYYDSSHETEIRRGIWTDGTQYVIQVSSWRTEEKATRRVNFWKAKNHNAFVQKVFVQKFKRTYYRVRIGYFDSLSEAEAYQRKLR